MKKKRSLNFINLTSKISLQLFILLSLLSCNSETLSLPISSSSHSTSTETNKSENYFDKGWKTKMEGTDSKAKLGMKLFFDSNLSNPPGQSCSSCHSPSTAFSDPDRSHPTSKGIIPGRFGNRNSPTAMYTAFNPQFREQKDEESGELLWVGGLFLDGRASTLEEQAKGPFLNPLEMNNPDKRTVVEKVQSAYAQEFMNEFGSDVFADPEKAYDRIAEVIATFERTPVFSPFSSKYDAFLEGKATLTQEEMRGLKLFEDPKKGNCAACHPSQLGSNGEHPLFTDFTYDNIGLPKNPLNPFYAVDRLLNPTGKTFQDIGLAGTTKQDKDKGRFKVPTLRNIALTAPYTHNGFFQTLKGTVEFYNSRDTRPSCKDPMTTESDALSTGCWPKPEIEETANREELGNLGLTEQDIDDIVSFLNTLTDS